MNKKVRIHNLTSYKLSFASTLRRVFSNQKEDKTMNIVIIDNKEMLRMNSFYRHKDYVTDVLSFPSDEDDSLGDIFICLEKAKEQAREYNHSLRREVSFLCVHGYLHLKGYDHETKKEEEEMMRITEEILASAGLRRNK